MNILVMLPPLTMTDSMFKLHYHTLKKLQRHWFKNSMNITQTSPPVPFLACLQTHVQVYAISKMNSITGHFHALSDPTVLKNILLLFMLSEN